MRLTTFAACGFFSRFRSCALPSVGRLVIESNDTFREHYFIHHVCYLWIYTLLRLLSIQWEKIISIINLSLYDSFALELGLFHWSLLHVNFWVHLTIWYCHLLRLLINYDGFNVIKLRFINYHISSSLIVTSVVIIWHYNCLSNIQSTC